jgi:hypothetical protein
MFGFYKIIIRLMSGVPGISPPPPTISLPMGAKFLGISLSRGAKFIGNSPPFRIFTPFFTPFFTFTPSSP